MIRSKKFRRYNYGFFESRKHYYNKTIPEWYLDMVRAPVHIFAGTSDRLVSIKDAKRVYDELKNSVEKSFTAFDIGN